MPRSNLVDDDGIRWVQDGASQDGLKAVLMTVTQFKSSSAVTVEVCKEIQELVTRAVLGEVGTKEKSSS